MKEDLHLLTGWAFNNLPHKIHAFGTTTEKCSGMKKITWAHFNMSDTRQHVLAADFFETFLSAHLTESCDPARSVVKTLMLWIGNFNKTMLESIRYLCSLSSNCWFRLPSRRYETPRADRGQNMTRVWILYTMLRTPDDQGNRSHCMRQEELRCTVSAVRICSVCTPLTPFRGSRSLVDEASDQVLPAISFPRSTGRDRMFGSLTFYGWLQYTVGPAVLVQR